MRAGAEDPGPRRSDIADGVGVAVLVVAEELARWKKTVSVCPHEDCAVWLPGIVSASVLTTPRTTLPGPNPVCASHGSRSASLRTV